jgi:hypothetical protein
VKVFLMQRYYSSSSGCLRLFPSVPLYSGWAGPRPGGAHYSGKKNPNLAIAEAQQLGAGVAEAFQRPKSAAEARGPVWGYGRPDV